ncbi:MAG TPA: dihydroorotase [Polyangiaceae bacterium]|nr:dihydroorotase [Polyangiaceae bacterium]
MTEAVVFRHVRAVDPAGALDAEVDVVVERGVVTRVGRDAAADLLSSERVRVVERQGAWLLPGFVDLHAHLREPGAEGKEDVKSGLRAAAAGGFVDVCCMPNTRPVNDSRVVTEMLVAKAREVGTVRLHPIGAITVGQRGEQLTEMADLKAAGAVAVSDDGRCVTSSQVMRRALEYAATFDLPVIQHAEDHALTDGAQMHEGAISTKLGLRGWPRVAEDIIVARDVLLAEYVGARYHVAHVSTAGAVRILRDAKARGVPVTAEVTPHHLLLTHEALLGYDTACKVNPPLREPEDVEALRRALADGTIDCIATDHAPHGVLDKHVELAEAAPGMIGLELCLPLMLGLVRKGALPLTRLLDALTRAPARIAGLGSPRIRDGARADLVLVDPLARWTVDPARLRTKSRNTPFAGQAVQGRVEITMCEGRIVHQEADAKASS